MRRYTFFPNRIAEIVFFTSFNANSTKPPCAFYRTFPCRHRTSFATVAGIWHCGIGAAILKHICVGFRIGSNIGSNIGSDIGSNISFTGIRLGTNASIMKHQTGLRLFRRQATRQKNCRPYYRIPCKHDNAGSLNNLSIKGKFFVYNSVPIQKAVIFRI